jgi:hypothetical protein
MRGRDDRHAPGQHDMQLFWPTMLGAVRAAAGTGEGGAQRHRTSVLAGAVVLCGSPVDAVVLGL